MNLFPYFDKEFFLFWRNLSIAIWTLYDNGGPHTLVWLARRRLVNGVLSP